MRHLGIVKLHGKCGVLIFLVVRMGIIYVFAQ